MSDGIDERDKGKHADPVLVPEHVQSGGRHVGLLEDVLADIVEPTDMPNRLSIERSTRANVMHFYVFHNFEMIFIISLLSDLICKAMSIADSLGEI